MTSVRECEWHPSEGEDCTLSTLLREALVSTEVIEQLAQAGVNDLEELITIVSRADHHEELRKCGISKLGARAKLATLVQPHWKALAYKEQGNAQYRASRFEDAAQLYTQALQQIACASTELALSCYSNRAACFQQMREPQLALADVEHVLRFDPGNAKALARKAVYDQQLAGGL
jgi:tetratricopeptide (TPR) repeat protein